MVGLDHFQESMGWHSSQSAPFLFKVQDSDIVILTLTGSSFEGVEFIADDNVTIIKKGSRRNLIAERKSRKKKK